MWILIITVLLGHGAAVTPVEFNNEESCIKAAAAYRKQPVTGGFNNTRPLEQAASIVSVICVTKR